ncbi:MAG: hypothetical protein JSR55_04235 [Proteobacteria bacterium]|nr:hypothetical protein [Pseudomonadota bacterium]
MTTTLVDRQPQRERADIALWRLYLLRAVCLLIAIGMGTQIAPSCNTIRKCLWAPMAGRDGGHRGNRFRLCSVGAIFLFIVPWDYVWRNFVAARGDRLR